MSCGNLDGGLWPFFWIAVAICITVYNLKKKNHVRPTVVPQWIESDAEFRERLLFVDSDFRDQIMIAIGHDLDALGRKINRFRQAHY